MPDIGNTYTQKATELRSQVGDNPEAIKQAFAKEAIATSQPLQETQVGQQEALQMLAAADKQYAQQLTQGQQAAQQQTQQIQGMNQALMAGSTVGQAPAQVAQIAEARTPDYYMNLANQYSQPTGLIDPFVMSQLASSQTDVGTRQMKMVSDQRADIARAIGSEAEQVAKIAEYQMEAERIKRELEEKRRKAEEERKLQEYQAAINYASIYGGEVVNPFTGQKEAYKSEIERKQQEEATKQGTPENKTAQVWNDILANANTEYDVWRQIDVNQDALKAQGVDVDSLWAWHKNLADRVGTGGQIGTGGGNVLDQAYQMPGASELINTGKDAAGREAIARGIKAAGSVEAYKKQQGIVDTDVVGGLKQKYGLETADSKKVMDSIRLISSMKELQSALNEAIAGKQTGRFRDYGIGVTGFLSQFAGTGGSDAASKARAKLNDFQAQVRNQMFGSALTDQELKQANMILPTTGAQEQDNLNRLNSKIDEKINNIYSTLRAYNVPEEEISAIISQSSLPSGAQSTTSVPTQPATNLPVQPIKVGRFEVKVK